MNLREMNYEIELNEEWVKPYERKVLESGLCDFAVPMSFYRSKGKEKIRYECSGYVALSDVKMSTLSEVFELLEKTLLALKKSGEFLINPEKILLTQDTVYFHHQHHDVRIAYMPGMWEQSYGNQNVMNFLGLLQQMVSNPDTKYFQNLQYELEQNNRSLSDMIVLVGEIRREIFLCNIQ